MSKLVCETDRLKLYFHKRGWVVGRQIQLYTLFKLVARNFYFYLCRSVCLSLEKNVKNYEFGLYMKTKVGDLLEYAK